MSNKDKQDKKSKKSALGNMVKGDDLLNQIRSEVENKELERLLQVIPRKLLKALTDAMEVRGTSLDEEVAIRLTATIIEHRAFGFNSAINALLSRKISMLQAAIEKEQNRKAWAYLFEQEKLKLYVEFKSKLPKDYKETFLYLDEKKAARVLREQKKLNDQEKSDGYY